MVALRRGRPACGQFATAQAVGSVNAASLDFYDTLMPEQKARFGRMNSRHAMRQLDREHAIGLGQTRI
jgi:hypothetical protein